MSTYIALLRGINVDGKNIMPMKELVHDLESLNLINVKSYIQSGNAVFQTSGNVSANLGARIAAAIEKRHGFKAQVFILSSDDLRSKFENASSVLSRSGADGPDRGSLEKAKSATEQFHLDQRVFIFTLRTASAGRNGPQRLRNSLA